MALTSGKNGKAHVLEISNRASVQKLTLTDVAGITNSLDNHYSGLNTNAHQIGNIAGLQAELNSKALSSHAHSISDVTNLQTELDNKADSFYGFTGSLSVVTAVNFGSSTVTTKTIVMENGIVTSIV